MLRRFNPSILRLLRVFNAVAKHRGFTAAETVLNIGQSTISSHIKDLEELLGCELCERGRSGFRLTEAGRRLYESSQRLERDLAAFLSAANDIRYELHGSVRIGIPHVVSRIPTVTGLHLAIGEMRRDHPSVQIEIHLDTAREIEEGVVEGRYDLAIGATHLKAKNLQITPLFGMKIGLYCSRGHPLYGVPDAQITADRLSEHSAEILIFDAHQQHPCQSSSLMIMESSEVILFYVLSGAFVGYLSEYVAQEWVDRGMIRALRPEVYSYDAPGALILQIRALDNPIVRKVKEVLLRISERDRELGDVEA
jgi:LysR family transcriptional regulator, transcriptional activator for bauABCD operon